MWQMVRMFGEKDRARYSNSKICGRWLVIARYVADG